MAKYKAACPIRAPAYRPSSAQRDTRRVNLPSSSAWLARPETRGFFEIRALAAGLGALAATSAIGYSQRPLTLTPIDGGAISGRKPRASAW